MYRRNLSKIIIIFSFSIMAHNFAANCFAQEVTQKDVDLSKLEKEYAENQAAIAKAKKDALDAKLPKVDASALVGGTTVKDGEFIESRILGYCAMKKAAGTVADSVNKKVGNGKTLVVYNEADLKMLSQYTGMMNRLKILENGYNELIDDYEDEIRNIINSPYNRPNNDQIRALIMRRGERSGVGAAVSMALNALTLFKTDVTLDPAEFDIGEKEFVSAFFEAYRGIDNSSTLYYPKTIPLNIALCTSDNTATCSPLLQRVMDVSYDQDTATNLIEYVQKELGKIRAALENRKDKLDRLIKLRKELENTQNPPSEARRAEIRTEIGTIQHPNIDVNDSISNLERSRHEDDEGIKEIDRDIIALTELAKRPDLVDRKNKLDDLFKAALEELGFKVEDDDEEEDEDKDKKVAADDAKKDEVKCPDKTCSQATNVTVSVSGEKKDDAKGGGGGGAGFTSYLQAESYFNVMNDPDSYWVDLSVVKAGGNMRIKNNIISNFVMGARVNFSGGAIVHFNVFSKDGISVSSGIVPAYKIYAKSSKVEKRCTETKD